MEKVYKVEFMQYTNATKTNVSNAPDTTGISPLANVAQSHETDCINIGDGPFLIRESELTKYMNYGKWFRELTFVGYMK